MYVDEKVRNQTYWLVVEMIRGAEAPRPTAVLTAGERFLIVAEPPEP